MQESKGCAKQSKAVLTHGTPRLFPLASELERPLPNRLADRLVGGEGVEPFGLRSALVAQNVKPRLGVSSDRVSNINDLDGGLTKYIGRRAARNLEPAIEGYVGMQNCFTYYLREFRPTCVFVPTPTDLHPDHQITHNELLISLFHASGDIWPELGAPLAVPQLFELAIDCDFADAPNLEVRGNDDVFQHKLRSIEAYRSQLQIASLVDSIRQDGPYEYLRDVHFRLYSSKKYRPLFAE